MRVERTLYKTHVVTNQPSPLLDYDAYDADKVLKECAAREGAGYDSETFHSIGKVCTSEEMLNWGVEANQYPPELETHDRFGHRIDQVRFHPSWHQLMAFSVQHQLHSLPWIAQEEGAFTARAIRYFLIHQAEAGHGCPITMTFAAIPLFMQHQDAFSIIEAGLKSREYDARFMPIEQKKGLICGMGMTEKQGGSDVRANTTKADKLSGDHGYLLTGHKWFCSAPMSDVFLMLAQASEGLTCFMVPRFLPDGSQNAFHIQRLKDKLGNRSNASSEIELCNTWGQRVGDEGRGVQTIIQMVNLTRFDCALGSAATMRQALVQAIHYSQQRKAFGKKLVDQPMMQKLLADLCLESEAATTLVMHLAHKYDSAKTDEDQAYIRIVTALSKYWVCKRAASFVAEALEVLGGSGYVEESILPRLYREAPLNSIWEGSGNVNCLDILRICNKTPEALTSVLNKLESVDTSNKAFKVALRHIKRSWLGKAGIDESDARVFVEQVVLALQAAVLLDAAPDYVSDAFCAARLSDQRSLVWGGQPASTDAKRIIERHFSI